MGQLLVRAGIPGVHLEFDVFGGSYRVVDQRSSSLSNQTGFAGVGLGLKIPLWPSDGGAFAISVQGVLWAPTDAFGYAEVAPALYVLSDIAIGPLGLGLNFGVAGSTDFGEEVISASVTPAVSVGHGFGVYAGWAATFEDMVDCEPGNGCRRGGDDHIGEAGVTFLASSDVQLDLNGGWDLDADAWFIGTGIALRWGAR